MVFPWGFPMCGLAECKETRRRWLCRRSLGRVSDAAQVSRPRALGHNPRRSEKVMECDVLIIGGGLAGASLACALRGSALRVVLVEQRPPVVAPGWDARVYAISPVNVDFLRLCGAWDMLPRERVQPIRRMDVNGDRGGRLAFDAYDSGLDALAWMVEGGRLASELWETARRQSNVSLLCPARPAELHLREDAVVLGLEDGREIRARLVVGADGVESWVRRQAGIPGQPLAYGLQGVVANFRCAQAHHGTAWQWFRDDGVLAYLPLPGNQISIVWSTPDDNARRLLALDPEAFCRAVEAAGGGRLGRLDLLAAPAGFPLRRMRLDSVIGPRVVLIGDAAHAVHPLSGHGINLGFQDASVLAELLRELGAEGDCGQANVLSRHARQRKEEVWLVQSVTHALHAMFQPRSGPLAWARNVGMSAADRLPLLRAGLARYAAGLV